MNCLIPSLCQLFHKPPWIRTPSSHFQCNLGILSCCKNLFCSLGTGITVCWYRNTIRIISTNDTCIGFQSIHLFRRRCDGFPFKLVRVSSLLLSTIFLQNTAVSTSLWITDHIIVLWSCQRNQCVSRKPVRSKSQLSKPKYKTERAPCVLSVCLPVMQAAFCCRITSVILFVLYLFSR